MLNLKEIREEIIKKYIGDILISELTDELKSIIITDLQSNPFKSNIELSIIPANIEIFKKIENILLDSKVNLKMGWERILINYILKDLFELNYEINKSCNEPLMFRIIISIDSYDD
ncbi:hypothetical protein [Clostridioides difficile]|uniref:Na+-translocating membrane potential-generating system MpsC domain-containing protein n=3 Tax=Clostridioides difficile TaxID=1496 RepID=A0AAX3GZ34_CLODI|nr:hypothetical protein [Clostridioides difficile]AVD35039.1 hypothetical protein C4E42_03990 [Clostridioides difficile]AVD38100.1 hypothetical protein C4E26_01445 [Clostridioides difficile]AVD41629.1 hypothetical protein C4E25_01450 [Clostridioides difficile]AXU68156.1 hypothetical protein CDIF29020_01855 [Clostridioides difficile]AXU90327.1 hypothetical protein CDIF29747_01811 [Clostridioides difficile]